MRNGFRPSTVCRGLLADVSSCKPKAIALLDEMDRGDAVGGGSTVIRGIS